MFIQDIFKNVFTLFRWPLCESVGSAKRRPASGVSEEPSQNCHQFMSQQQRRETAVSFSGQVQGQVYVTVCMSVIALILYEPDLTYSLCLSFQACEGVQHNQL